MKATTSERLAEAMKLRNMSASQLSEKTGISKSSISRYLSGDYDPGKENFFKIASVLNINPNWLAGKESPVNFSTLSTDDQLAENEKEPADQLPFFGRVEHITDEEYSVLNAYRTADTNIQNAIKLMLKVES